MSTPNPDPADLRGMMRALLANQKLLTDWMREHTGPRDGTRDMLIQALGLAMQAEAMLADPPDPAPVVAADPASRSSAT